MWGRKHTICAGPRTERGPAPATAPSDFPNAAQVSDITAVQTNHEVRLSSQERIAGIFDYVVGVMWNNNSNPTRIDVQTPAFIGTTARPLSVTHTPALRTGGSQEFSYCGNITAHLSNSTEILGGIRRIRYDDIGVNVYAGVRAPDRDWEIGLYAKNLLTRSVF